MEVGRGHKQWRWWAGSSLGDKNILERSTLSVVPFTHPFGLFLPALGLITVVSVLNDSWAPYSRVQQGSLLRGLLGCAVVGGGMLVNFKSLPTRDAVCFLEGPSMTPGALLRLAI